MKKKALAILTLCISLFAAAAWWVVAEAVALPAAAVAAARKSQPWI